MTDSNAKAHMLFDLIAGAVVVALIYVVVQSRASEDVSASLDVALSTAALQSLAAATTNEPADLDLGRHLVFDAAGCFTYQLSVLKSVQAFLASDPLGEEPVILVRKSEETAESARSRALMLRKISGFDGRFVYTDSELFTESVRVSAMALEIDGQLSVSAHEIVPFPVSQVLGQEGAKEDLRPYLD